MDATMESTIEVTIPAIEQVMEETGLDYKEAKELLIRAGGDPDKAVSLFFEDSSEDDADGENEKRVSKLLGKIKARVNEGNVDRVQIKQGKEIILSVPVNVGILGGIIGIVAAPWALIAGTIAAIGFGCTIEVIKKDGTTDIVA